MKKFKISIFIYTLLVFMILVASFIWHHHDYSLIKELRTQKKEYLNVNKKIEEYTKLKNEMDIINGENISLNDKITSLNNDIESTNNTISNYNNKISELNNKISIMTGTK